MLKIREVSEAIATDLDQLNKLLPQLSQSAKPVEQCQFNEIVNSSTTHLYFAEENNLILGMLCLVIFPIPTGVRAWIEDVVVDANARGRGVGKILTLHAVVEAEKYGAQTVDLTSRPSREAANKLYQSVGFQARETNVYRYRSHS
jgi:ribosomal protein S18 acetylase RimI-like enzyme